MTDRKSERRIVRIAGRNGQQRGIFATIKLVGKQTVNVSNRPEGAKDIFPVPLCHFRDPSQRL